MAKFFAICFALALLLITGLPTSPAAARVGAKCGGFAGLTCGPSEFCEKPTGACFFPDGEGTCVRVPHFCPLYVKPVCGCDGHTYGNDCERMRARVSKAHDGRCF